MYMKALVGAFNKNCRNKKYVVPDFHKNYADSTFQNFHHCQLHTYVHIYIWTTWFFFFNQGSSGGLPTLGIQDVLRAILVELDDWLKLVAYSSNPIHSFPQLNWQKKKEKKKKNTQREHTRFDEKNWWRFTLPDCLMFNSWFL